MNITKFKHILNQCGVNNFKNFRLNKVSTLVSSSNMNVDYHRDVFSYDDSLNILKIKQYSYRCVSGKINPFKIQADKKTLLSFGNISLLPNHYQSDIVRTGDVLFVLEKSTGNLLEEYNIINAGLRFVQLDREFTYPENSLVGYRKNIENVEQDEADPLLYFVYKPYTTNTTDIFIDVSSMVGIELTIPGRFGSSGSAIWKKKNLMKS